MTQTITPERLESLSSAERILQTLTTYVDHMYHGRTGYNVEDPSNPSGYQWYPGNRGVKEGVSYFYKQITKKKFVKIGRIDETGLIRNDDNRVIGQYQPAGLIKHVAIYLYKQVAQVWENDNEFAARWASFEFGREYRDLQTVLAAFMLVQTRKGDPIRENGKTLFLDDNYRLVGEAMLLIGSREKRFQPKQLAQILEILRLPEIMEINRQLGFTRSTKNPHLGRFPVSVRKWLEYRESNPPLLEGLIRNGMTSLVRTLCKSVKYKPQGGSFFQRLGWKQKQSKTGHRQIAIGEDVQKAESWDNLSEAEICAKIAETKPAFKKAVGMLPPSVGLTQAVMVALIENKGLSPNDFEMLSPTLEELGLLDVPSIRAQWVAARDKVKHLSQRAVTISERMKKKENQDSLKASGAAQMTKAMEKVTQNIRLFIVVDKSSSMKEALDKSKILITRIMAGFPPDKVHVSIFNDYAQIMEFQTDGDGNITQACVEHAFRNHRSSGGTNYGSGVEIFRDIPLQDEEDAVFLFIGDQLNGPGSGLDKHFAPAFARSGITPVALGMLNVKGSMGQGRAVTQTAMELGIPCFDFDENTFSDVSSGAVIRMLRNFIEATPVSAKAKDRGGPRRDDLIEKILKTDLLSPPAWAIVG